jgi:hypothetical protein
VRRWKSTIRFAEENVLLDGEPFRVSDRPQLRIPLEVIDAALGGKVILMMPPQRGKTLAAQLRLVRNVAVEPRRSLWYSKSQIDARSLSDAKLKPLIESTKPVQAVQYDDPDRRGRGLLYRFHGGPIELLSADVVSHRNSRSGSEIYLDEAWQYEPRAMSEISMRGDGYKWNRREIIATTAPDAGHELDVLWQSSTKHEWHMVCPDCKVPFMPDVSEAMTPWESVMVDDGRYNVEVTAASVRLVTPCCGKRWEYSPQVLKAMNSEKDGAGYRQTNPTPAKRVHGFHFNVLSTDSWPEVIAEWLRALNAKRGGDPSQVREFKIKKLCVPWDPNKERKPVGEIELGPYNLREAWEHEAKDEQGRPYRFMTVDVQRNHFWAVVRAHSSDGRSRLIDRAKLLTPHEIAEMADGHGVLRGGWYEQRTPSGQWVVLCDSRVFLDSKYSPGGLVPRICAEHGFHAFLSYKRAAFKHSDGIHRIYDEGRMIDPFSGTSNAERVGKRVLQFYFVADAAKDRMDILRSQNGPDGFPMWTAAQDCGDEYKAQMLAEAKVKTFGPDGHTFEYKWKRLDKDNHYFDCETMQIVCASMAGLIGQDELAGYEKGD